MQGKSLCDISNKFFFYFNPIIYTSLLLNTVVAYDALAVTAFFSTTRSEEQHKEVTRHPFYFIYLS